MTLHKLLRVAAAAASLAALYLVPARAVAQTATQTVTFQVLGVNRISVSGNPATLTINAATAGSDLDAATDNSSSYSFTTNELDQKIIGAITTGSLPSGVELQVTLAGGDLGEGTSAGAKALSGTGQDLVTGISQAKASGRSISYSLSAELDAAVMESSSNVVVTFTLTSGT